MSIGGTIISVDQRPIEGRPSYRLWVLNLETQEEKAVHIAAWKSVPAVGDFVWWDVVQVYWTKADCSVVDHPLEKIGSSYDPREEDA